MKNQSMHIFRQMSNAVCLAGLIILMIGLYYILIKAGIPYQDPTVEMQVRYGIDHGIGSVLSKTGLIFALCGGIVRLVLGRLVRD